MRLQHLMLGLLTAATLSRAEQFLTIDTLFEYGVQSSPPYTVLGAHVQSHMNLQFGPEVPMDWTSPNYSQGTMQIRYEIHSKTDAPNTVSLQICINKDSPLGSGQNTDWHTCVTCGGFWDAPQVAYTTDPAPNWFKYPDEPTWNIMGSAYPQLVVKEGGGCSTPICTGCNWSNWSGYPDLSLYYPFTVRVTAFMVSQGAEFEKPDYWDSEDFIGAVHTRAAGGMELHGTQSRLRIARTSSELTACFSSSRIADAHLFAVDGSRVNAATRMKGGALTLDTRTVRAGSYLLRARDDQGRSEVSVVILQ